MKKIIALILSLIVIFALFACNEKGEQTNVEILQSTLNTTNAPNEVDDFSIIINDHTFKYENAFTYENSHVGLDKAGFLTNETPFGDLQSVTINYGFINAENKNEQNLYGFGYLKYRVSDNFIDNPNDHGYLITNVNQDVTIDLSKTDNDNFISFWSPRKVKINSLTFNYADKEYVKNNKDFVIQIISTNDIHGQVKPTDYYPGLSALGAKMQSIASTGDRYNILIDQGDLYQGTAEAGLSNGYNLDDFLLVNGFESTTLGNHEFDWGEQRIIDHVNYSSTTILANNVRYVDDGSSPDWATPYKLVSRNGVKIGIIGAVGDVEGSIASSKMQGMTFLTGDDLTEQIQKDSTALKEMGADFIILSLHDGGYEENNRISSLPYYDINALSGTYVDLVLEAHTHQRYRFYDKKGVWHIQGSSNGSNFFVSKLNCKYENGEYSVSMSTATAPTYCTKNQIVAVGEDIPYKLVDKWYEQYLYGAKQSEIVGKNVPYMDDAVFEQLTAQIYYNYGVEMAKISGYTPIIGGGFIRTRTPYNLHSGTVSYGDVYNLLPFDNDLVLCSITGYNLKTKFINRNDDDYYIYPKISADNIVDTNIYYIITDSYTSDYSYNNLTVIENYTILYNAQYARDIFSQYLKSAYLN